MESGLIAVDRWVSGSQAYFLTHLHSDHTVGLSSAWVRGPLYCSRLTAKLFPFKFPEFRLSLLRILDIGSWHSLYLISPSSSAKTIVEVMAIDAHHCPGSVMYLFRGVFGYMLHTGDFRWETTDERAKVGRKMLLSALQGNVVDTIYLDNTYCNPAFSFPPREIAAQQVVDIILSHPEHDIIIGIDSLGKEELLLHISRALKMKIWVWPERLQILHLLGFHDTFTTKTSVTRVRAVPRYSFSMETLKGLNMVRPTLGIMPSGLPWAPMARTDHSFSSSGHAERLGEYSYSVPYSDHSCFGEIRELVKLLRPNMAKGIVASSFWCVDPPCHLGHLRGEEQASDGGCRVPRRGVVGRKKSKLLSGSSVEAARRRSMTGRRIGHAGYGVRRRRGVKIAESSS